MRSACAPRWARRRVLRKTRLQADRRRPGTELVALANATPCDPKTLTRAARNFARTNPAFAVEAGLAALRWLVHGYGYEVASVDVRAAYSHTLTAAAHAGVRDAVRTRNRVLFDEPATRNGLVASVIGKEVGLD